MEAEREVGEGKRKERRKRKGRMIIKFERKNSTSVF